MKQVWCNHRDTCTVDPSCDHRGKHDPTNGCETSDCSNIPEARCVEVPDQMVLFGAGCTFSPEGDGRTK